MQGGEHVILLSTTTEQVQEGGEHVILLSTTTEQVQGGEHVILSADNCCCPYISRLVPNTCGFV